MQKYNKGLRKSMQIAGIDRIVTTRNPKSGESEQHRLCDIASSHMTRRTFIGNLYKKVKDPNLVGKLSGHVEGSKAFARYRDIDDDMIREMTDLLSSRTTKGAAKTQQKSQIALAFLMQQPKNQ